MEKPVSLTSPSQRGSAEYQALAAGNRRDLAPRVTRLHCSCCKMAVTGYPTGEVRPHVSAGSLKAFFPSRYFVL